jgi:lipopolysaccharide export system protein LptA
MAFLYPDRRPLGPWTALFAAGALLLVQPGYPAGATREPIQVSGSNPAMNYNTGTLSMEKLELTQGSTTLKADKAEAAGLVEGNYDNSTWQLTGAVHLEKDGAVLDAQSATITFAGGNLKSAQVQPDTAPPQAKNAMHLEFNSTVLDARSALVTFAENRLSTVHAEGAPAQFSHQLKSSARRVNGSATRIDYDAGKNHIRISGGVKFTDGSSQLQLADEGEGNYNLTTGVFSSDAQTIATFQPKDKVPAPRTPDRGTAR